MRILKANGVILDIDDETAIGIDYQAYDFKKAGDIKVNVSNTFTIPATAKNLKIFGFAGRAYSYENATYAKILIDYYIRNTQYITKGVARLEKIEGGRINLFVAERPEFIDQMKTVELNTFLSNWFNNAFTNTTFATFQEFVDAYRLGHNSLLMPLMVGNLALYEDVNGRKPEGIGIYTGTGFENRIAMSVKDDNLNSIAIGGHFLVEIRALIEYIEIYFQVDLKSGIEKDYSIYNDPILDQLIIPVRNILYATPEGGYNLTFINSIPGYYNFRPQDDVVPYQGLTVYDLFSTTLKILGYAIEPLEDGGYEVVRLDMINQIQSETGDLLPGYMADKFPETSFMPNIEGYGVNNLIKMKPYAEGGELLGAKTSVSANKNLDETKDLFKIDAYIPPFLFYDNAFVPNMSASESFKNITFFKKTTLYKEARVIGRCSVTALGEVILPAGLYADMMVPEVYTVASEYQFLDNILGTPETRKIKRWVNSSMLKGFRKLAPYYVREFGAWYFVNKISNFNPEKSNEPVEFELIRLPWVRVPNLPIKEVDATEEWILANGIWNDSGIWIDTETWNDN